MDEWICSCGLKSTIHTCPALTDEKGSDCACVWQALKKFGKDDKERWEHVSQVVPGKSKAECMRRFKELRESFRSKKDAN